MTRIYFKAIVNWSKPGSDVPTESSRRFVIEAANDDAAHQLVQLHLQALVQEMTQGGAVAVRRIKVLEMGRQDPPALPADGQSFRIDLRARVAIETMPQAIAQQEDVLLLHDSEISMYLVTGGSDASEAAQKARTEALKEARSLLEAEGISSGALSHIAFGTVIDAAKPIV